MSNVQRREHIARLLEEGVNGLHEKLDGFRHFIKKNLPGYLEIDTPPSLNNTSYRELEAILFQILGEESEKKLEPYAWFFFDALLELYSIGLNSESEYVRNWEAFQEKCGKFLKDNFEEMGLDETEVDILGLICAKLSTKESERIIRKISTAKKQLIKTRDVLYLETLFELAIFMVLEAPRRESGERIIDNITIHPDDQEITILADCMEFEEKEQLDAFGDRIEAQLKDMCEDLDDFDIKICRVNFEVTVEGVLPQLNEEYFFGRGEAVKRIIKLSEHQKIAIIPGPSGAGISSTLKFGVKPAMQKLGAHVVYCKVDKNIQKFLLESLDHHFPDNRAENLLAHIKLLGTTKQPVVFILDQFENVFLIDDSNKFSREILNLIGEFTRPGIRNIRLVLGIRDDFLGDLRLFLKDTRFYKRDVRYHLKNFSRQEAEEVIIKTIEKMGVPMNMKFIETVLDDLTQTEATIFPPLIRILLSNIYFRYREHFLFGTENDPFNIRFYDKLGGASTILVDYAREKIKNLDEEDEKICTDIIQMLVTPFYTRQRVNLKEILQVHKNQEKIEKQLQRLRQLRFINRIQTGDGSEYELVHDSLNGLVPETATVITSSFIREAMAYIDANFAKPISLQDVAQKFGLSPEHLSRKFKSGLNIGFKEYIIQKRIDEAKQLLIRFPELPINELSQMTGFTSPQHFINTFKSETRFTPLKFRQQMLLRPNAVDKPGMSH